MPEVATDADFDQLSWHDAQVCGIEFRVGDDVNEFLADLVLTLEVITSVACGLDGVAKLETARATLVFHTVTDLRIELEWESSGNRVLMHELSIGTIERVEPPVEEQEIVPGRTYYLWRIAINWPVGEITFGAAGFTQTLHADRRPGGTIP